MQRNCLKCGKSNSHATGDTLEECPGCGAIYSRVEASIATSSAQSPVRPPRQNSKKSSGRIIVASIISGAALLIIAAYLAGSRPQQAKHAKATSPQTAASQSKPTRIVRTAKPAVTEVSQPSTPQATEVKVSQDEARKLCASASELANSIMTARQNNVPMAKAMELQAATDNQQARDIAQAMVIAAYEKPRYNTPEFIATAISDFESEMYLHCIKAM
ncbi:hypothetical protein [Pseudoxanthomonas mexicana]